VSSHPYRCNEPELAEPESAARPEVAVAVTIAAFWLVSAGRVTAGIALGERFGAEATLAAMTVVLLPILWFRRGIKEP
jgi:hypothetical protein